MTKSLCSACYAPKAPLQCSLCEVSLCKKCSVFLHKEDYSLFSDFPAFFEKSLMCPTCFNTEAKPTLDHYAELEQQARDLPYFSEAQSKETRLMPRTHPVITVTDMSDRSDVIMKLAFKTLELGHNSMIDVVTKSVKVRHGGYQKMMWSGSAIPTTLDLEVLARRQERQ